MKNKRILSLILSIIMLLGTVSASTSAYAEETGDICVYFTLSIYGDFASDKNGNDVALAQVDLAGKDSYTLEDVFEKAHKLYYDGDDGYAVNTPSSGSPYLTKLWGDTSGYFGYQINAGSESVWDLNHEVKDGDCIDAAIYKNAYPDTENYSYFHKYSVTAITGKEITLTLNESGYGADFTPYVIPCSDAEIYINGSATDIWTSSDGTAALSFDEAGEYIVSAKKEKQISSANVPAITAPVCKVNVKDTVDVMHAVAKKYSASSLATDGNMPWFVSDLISYERIFPQSEYKLSDETIQACLDKIIELADSATSPGDLSKYIIALRSLGYDAKSITTKDLRNIDIVSRLTELVDNKNTSVANVYTLPYVIMALQQGTYYATSEQLNYLKGLALENKASWQAPSWGTTDNIGPMVTALAPYYNTDEDIKAAIDTAADALKNAQSATGATGNAASTALTIVAFSSVGTDADKVTKDGKSLIDGIMTQVNDTFDGFKPTSNTFSTEQGMRALVAWQFTKENAGLRVYDFASNPMNPAVATPEDNGDTPDSPQIPDDNSDETISVNIKVMSHDGSKCSNSYTYRYNSAKYSPLAGNSLTMSKGASVYDALIKLLNESGIDFEEGSPGYISSINGLEEKDHGNNSGWMYTVDGKHVTVGCREKKLNTSCTVIWFYTDNYTLETSTASSGGSSSGGGSSSSASSSKTANVKNVIADTAKYLYKSTSNPTLASVGGEWLILGLARGGAEIPEEYYQKYYSNVSGIIKDNKGIVHNNKYTEYARLVLTLTAIGKSPENVGGYNILTPLGDYNKVCGQGINSPIWALIALDSKNYDMPLNTEAEIQATRQMYVDYILDKECKNGGWALDSNAQNADADITAMALIALSKYRDSDKVNSAIDRALTALSKMQNKNGGYSDGISENAESTAQVLTALSSLGISYKDSRFTKNKNTCVDAILKYYKSGKGFMRDGSPNSMTTEQCLYALVSAQRLIDGKNPLFDMSDSIRIGETSFGLPGKSDDVKFMAIKYPGKSFDDISGHGAEAVVESLAQKGIINGISSNEFAPNRTMTRAEFATIVSRGLGLEDKSEISFEDISVTEWYYEYVKTAYHYGIVKGTSEKTFNPIGVISKEEAATMIARAASLCGLNTEITADGARNILAAFTDYTDVSEWAMIPLAFCYSQGILDDSQMEINSNNQVTRAEIAQMLYNMLEKAELI